MHLPACPRAALTIVAAVLCCGLAFAQGKDKGRSDTNTRTVRGVITGAAKQPVNGAVVQLKDTRTLQIRSFITKADGEYHFTGLGTNVDYELRADHDGNSSGTSKKVAVINLTLKK
jgi:hypothetical protein